MWPLLADAPVRFVLGAMFGSFIGVLAERYDPDRPLFSRASLGGRSRCAACGKILAWYELLPVVSFLVQRGRCRSCGAGIPPRVFMMELLTGCAALFVPAAFFPLARAEALGLGVDAALLGALWTAAFAVLILMAFIDLRLRIIPDEVHVLLALLAVARIAVSAGIPAGVPAEAGAGASFAGPYAFLFGIFPALWMRSAVGALAGALLFGGIFAATGGRGMGFGDVKLAFSLGLLFGWPDVALLSAFAFIIGSAFGIAVIAAGRKTRKSMVPFGPFLALGAATLFFFGADIVRWYFGLFPV